MKKHIPPTHGIRHGLGCVGSTGSNLQSALSVSRQRLTSMSPRPHAAIRYGQVKRT